jgi:hypothetical protein
MSCTCIKFSNDTRFIQNLLADGQTATINRFDNVVECDSNADLHECSYMCRSKYDHPQKTRQHIEDIHVNIYLSHTRRRCQINL